MLSKREPADNASRYIIEGIASIGKNMLLMFSLSERHHYYLFQSPTDMRKGFDGLSGLVSNALQMDPLSGDVYMFINRRCNRMKLLVWEAGGFVLYYKRLERGRFEYPVMDQDAKSAVITWHQLTLIVKGIDLKSVKHRKRFLIKRSLKKQTNHS